MQEASFQLIKELTEIQATSGHEDQVRDYLKEKLTPLVDELQTDGLGSLFGIKRSKKENAPTVMVAGHMDEVGFMVEQIKDNGLLKVVALGGWNPQVVSAQRFTLQTQSGNYPAASSSIPPHLLDKSASSKVDVGDILFDAGFESSDQAHEAGVRPGDSLVPDVETIQMANPNRVLGKAFDNRYGVAMVVELMESMKDIDLPYHLVAGATVQEEVGLRGAKSAVHRFDPDFFIAVDASPANDLTGKSDSMGQLGQGFLLRVQDPGMITPRPVRQYITDLADQQEINYQYYFSKGGTDAVAAQTMKNGIPSCVIGCPARYIHTHQSIFDMRDYLAAKKILLAVCDDLNENIIERFKEF